MTFEPVDPQRILDQIAENNREAAASRRRLGITDDDHPAASSLCEKCGRPVFAGNTSGLCADCHEALDGPPQPVMVDPLVLACGHVAAERERLRPGDEHWCTTCARWIRPGDVHVDDDPALARARSILVDHAAGLHDDDTYPDGCSYPGCDDAFWIFARDQENRSLA